MSYELLSCITGAQHMSHPSILAHYALSLPLILFLPWSFIWQSSGSEVEESAFWPNAVDTLWLSQGPVGQPSLCVFSLAQSKYLLLSSKSVSSWSWLGHWGYAYGFQSSLWELLVPKEGFLNKGVQSFPEMITNLCGIEEVIIAYWSGSDWDSSLLDHTDAYEMQPFFFSRSAPHTWNILCTL